MVHNFSNPLQSASLVYEDLDNQTHAFLQKKVNETHGLLKRTSQDIIQIGQNLLEIKAALPHGRFYPWLQAEFALTERTALNFMRVATRFGDQAETISDLPAAILYELAAPSTPDEVIDMVQNQEIAPTLETIRAAKKALLLAQEAESQARAEAKAAQSQLAAQRQEMQILQERITALTQEIDASQGQIHIQEIEVEKLVVPPEMLNQMERLRETVAQLAQQRDGLIRRVNELSAEAIASASRQREPAEERRIRANWYRMSREIHTFAIKVQTQWPSPLDTLAFEAVDWNSLSEIRALGQRLVDACEHLTSQHIVESRPL